MSDPFASLHDELFALDDFTRPAQITRAPAAPVPVRVTVGEGVERIGDYGQAIGRVLQVGFRVSQFLPQQGDVVTLLDDLGATVWVKTVASVHSDDGYVVKAVMHG